MDLVEKYKDYRLFKLTDEQTEHRRQYLNKIKSGRKLRRLKITMKSRRKRRRYYEKARYNKNG